MTQPTDDEAVDLLHEMLTIGSPSGQEQELAGFLAARLAKLGFACRIDEVGNVIGEIGTGDGPTIMLLSHLVGKLGALGYEVTLCRTPEPEPGGPATTQAA